MQIDLKKACEDLGYNWIEVGRYSKKYKFNSKEEIINTIYQIIDLKGYYPSCAELGRSFHIYTRNLLPFINHIQN